MTWSSMVVSAGRLWSPGLNTLKFSNSVISGRVTCWRTSAIWSSPATSRRCSAARAPPGAAVGDEADRLVVPLGVQVVDGVLEHARGAVVVLGCDDDEAVERGDLRRPLPGVLVLVLAERRGQRFVQVRERVVAQVEEFEVGVVAARGSLQHPAGDLLAVAVGAGAAQDDPDSAHGTLLAG